MSDSAGTSKEADDGFIFIEKAKKLQKLRLEMLKIDDDQPPAARGNSYYGKWILFYLPMAKFYKGLSELADMCTKHMMKDINERIAGETDRFKPSSKLQRICDMAHRLGSDNCPAAVKPCIDDVMLLQTALKAYFIDPEAEECRNANFFPKEILIEKDIGTKRPIETEKYPAVHAIQFSDKIEITTRLIKLFGTYEMNEPYGKCSLTELLKFFINWTASREASVIEEANRIDMMNIVDELIDLEKKRATFDATKLENTAKQSMLQFCDIMLNHYVKNVKTSTLKGEMSEKITTLHNTVVEIDKQKASNFAGMNLNRAEDEKAVFEYRISYYECLLGKLKNDDKSPELSVENMKDRLGADFTRMREIIANETGVHMATDGGEPSTLQDQINDLNANLDLYQSKCQSHDNMLKNLQRKLNLISAPEEPFTTTLRSLLAYKADVPVPKEDTVDKLYDKLVQWLTATKGTLEGFKVPQNTAKVDSASKDVNSLTKSLDHLKNLTQQKNLQPYLEDVIPEVIPEVLAEPGMAKKVEDAKKIISNAAYILGIISD